MSKRIFGYPGYLNLRISHGLKKRLDNFVAGYDLKISELVRFSIESVISKKWYPTFLRFEIGKFAIVERYMQDAVEGETPGKVVDKIASLAENSGVHKRDELKTQIDEEIEAAKAAYKTALETYDELSTKRKVLSVEAESAPRSVETLEAILAEQKKLDKPMEKAFDKIEGKISLMQDLEEQKKKIDLDWLEGRLEHLRE